MWRIVDIPERHERFRKVVFAREIRYELLSGLNVVDFRAIERAVPLFADSKAGLYIRCSTR